MHFISILNLISLKDGASEITKDHGGCKGFMHYSDIKRYSQRSITAQMNITALMNISCDSYQLQMNIA